MNNVSLIGNLTREPELKEVGGGRAKWQTVPRGGGRPEGEPAGQDCR